MMPSPTETKVNVAARIAWRMKTTPTLCSAISTQQLDLRRASIGHRHLHQLSNDNHCASKFPQRESPSGPSSSCLRYHLLGPFTIYEDLPGNFDVALDSIGGSIR